MIWESCHWKSDLLKQAASLRKRTVQKRWVDASFARLEQTIMLGFFSIRKLMQSAKLTDMAARQQIAVRSYPPTGKAVTLLNTHRLEQLYDLEEPSERAVSLPFLCNQVIHSYVFEFQFEEGAGPAAILVASDRQRSKELLEVSIEAIIEAFDRVGRDDVSVAKFTFDPKRGDYRYVLEGADEQVQEILAQWDS